MGIEIKEFSFVFGNTLWFTGINKSVPVKCLFSNCPNLSSLNCIYALNITSYTLVKKTKQN